MPPGAVPQLRWPSGGCSSAPGVGLAARGARRRFRAAQRTVESTRKADCFSAATCKHAASRFPATLQLAPARHSRCSPNRHRRRGLRSWIRKLLLQRAPGPAAPPPSRPVPLTTGMSARTACWAAQPTSWRPSRRPRALDVACSGQAEQRPPAATAASSAASSGWQAAAAQLSRRAAGALLAATVTAAATLSGVPGLPPPAAEAVTQEQLLFLEAWRAVDRAYVDKKFNGQNWFKARQLGRRGLGCRSRGRWPPQAGNAAPCTSCGTTCRHALLPTRLLPSHNQPLAWQHTSMHPASPCTGS